MRSVGGRTAFVSFAVVWLGATLAGCGGGGPTRASEPAYGRALRPKVEALVKELAVPGAVVVVRSPKLGDWSAAFGTRTVGGSQPPSIDDHFRIGSTTKPMTATVILQLVQEGKLRLEDPVAKHLPTVPNGGNITVEQLLTMRSGLYSYTGTLQWIRAVDQNPRRAWAPDELLAIGYANPPKFPPGKGWNYSNTNTVLLGQIIEKLSGDPLETAFEKRIFKPLGLKDTFLPNRTSSAIPDPHPQGYRFGTFEESLTSLGKLPPDQQAAAKSGTLKPNDVTDTNPSFAWSAGGVVSTAPDLARYVKALVGGGLLNERLQKQRLDSLQVADPDHPNYRYGYNIDAPGPLIGHAGDIPGFNCEMRYDPTRDIAVVVWTSLNFSPDGRAPGEELLKVVQQKLYSQPVSTVPEDPAF